MIIEVCVIMEKQDKRLIFVLIAFIISVSILLIIMNTSNPKSVSVTFEKTDTTSTQVATPEESVSITSTSTVQFPLDLNKANIDELMAIEGIGEVTATEIINYRNEHIIFHNIDELLDVNGIGEKTFEKLKKYLFVTGDNLPLQESDTLTQSHNATTTIATAATKPSAIVVTTVPKTSSVTTRKTTTAPAVTSTIITTKINYPLDINFATYDELLTLNGIGPTKAQSIIDYRQMNGYFYLIFDLLNVSGIGDSTLEKIKEYIYIDLSKLPEQMTTVPLETTTPEATRKTTAQTKPPKTEKEVTQTEITTTTIEIVNINTATLEEFMTLPNMTIKIAQAIIDHRSHEGCSFTALLELCYFMTHAMYNSILPYITL